MFITKTIILGLSINIRSTVLKKRVFFKVCNLFILKNLHAKTGNGFIEVECFDSTVIRFNLEHHQLDINL